MNRTIMFHPNKEKSSAAIMKEMVDMYEMVRPMCISETGVDKSKVDALEAIEWTDDANVFCYAGCIMNKLDIVRSIPILCFV